MIDNKRWKVLSEAVGQSKAIVEVGLLRADTEDHRLGDGHSTRFFSEYILANPGTKYLGIDIDPEAVALCKRLFPHMKFMVGDGLHVPHADKVDFLYLDGSDCPKEALCQFLGFYRGVIKTVVIDDTFMKVIDDDRLPGSIGYNYWIGKGAILMPYLDAIGWNVSCEEDYMGVAYND